MFIIIIGTYRVLDIQLQHLHCGHSCSYWHGDTAVGAAQFLCISHQYKQWGQSLHQRRQHWMQLILMEAQVNMSDFISLCKSYFRQKDWNQVVCRPPWHQVYPTSHHKQCPTLLVSRSPPYHVCYWVLLPASLVLHCKLQCFLKKTKPISPLSKVRREYSNTTLTPASHTSIVTMAAGCCGVAALEQAGFTAIAQEVSKLPVTSSLTKEWPREC